MSLGEVAGGGGATTAVDFVVQIELIQNKIRGDYSNCKHRRGRYGSLEKKLLGEIACAAEEGKATENMLCARDET